MEAHLDGVGREGEHARCLARIELFDVSEQYDAPVLVRETLDAPSDDDTRLATLDGSPHAIRRPFAPLLHQRNRAGGRRR